MQNRRRTIGRHDFLTTIIALTSGAWLAGAMPSAWADEPMETQSSAAPHSGQAAASGDAAAGSAGTNDARVASKYTCPMHPEVVSAQPGRCPKCGMYLEESKP